MTSALISLLLLALVMLLVWWILAKFLPAVASQIIGVIFGILLLIRALPLFGVNLP